MQYVCRRVRVRRRGRSGKLLIFRLTPRGTTRPRLELTTSALTSRRMRSRASVSRVWSRGGNGRYVRQRAASHTQSMGERQSVGVAGPRQGAQCGVVHECTNREVGEEKAPGFLQHQLGCLAAQHAAWATQMGLELIEGVSISQRSW